MRALLNFVLLLALQALLNFRLLTDNLLIAHPIWHDDYNNLSLSFSSFSVASPRFVSTFLITCVAALGPKLAYVALNLLTLTFVYLSLRFVEMFVYAGRRLPILAFAGAGAGALAFPYIIDWTKYLGLLTNLSSGIFGLLSMIALSAYGHRLWSARRALPLALGFAYLAFFAKEDFGLPILLVAMTFALLQRGRRWPHIIAALAAGFAAAMLYNRLVGSPFTAGAQSTTAPYYVSIAPQSLLHSYRYYLTDSGYTRWLLAGTLLSLLIPCVFVSQRPEFVLKRICLLLIPFSLVAPYSVLPNHLTGYYGLTWCTLLCAAAAAGLCSRRESPDAHPVV